MEERLLIEKFRSLIQTETDFDDTTLTDALLICFLRARQNNLTRSVNLFKNYLKLALNNPNLMAPPTKADLKRVLKFGYYCISPVREPNSGCRVGLINHSDWDNSLFDIELGFQCMVSSMQYLISEEESQFRGIILLIDAKSVTFNQIRQLGTIVPLRFAALCNNTLPIRLKGIHVVNEPLITRYFVNMVWPFLSAKTRKRVHFHGASMESLHRHVDPNCLPVEYGGSLGSIKKMGFYKFILSRKLSNVFDCFNKQLTNSDDTRNL